MNKPLKDWTLRELKDYCRKRNCDGRDGKCRFDQFCERITDGWYSPEEWDLTDPSRFTSEEVVRAKALLKVMPDAVAIDKGNDGIWAVQRADRPPDDPWPSIRPGQTVKISEIIGG